MTTQTIAIANDGGAIYCPGNSGVLNSGVWTKSTANNSQGIIYYLAQCLDPSCGIDTGSAYFFDNGFDIPLTATVDGISVTIYQIGSSTANELKVALFEPGSVAPDNSDFKSEYQTTTAESLVYGSPTDDWLISTSWTPAKINDFSFGPVIKATLYAQTYSYLQAHIYEVITTVYFTNEKMLQGSQSVSDVYNGSTRINRVYRGSNLVFDAYTGSDYCA